MSAFGTSRHFAAAQQLGRFWSEADFNSGTQCADYSSATIGAAFVLASDDAHAVVEEGVTRLTRPVEVR
jgi:hypothetical protein